MSSSATLEAMVRHAYHDLDVNCAKAALLALGSAFGHPVDQGVMRAATAMNGAGRRRAQCGLLEGPLMFMGLYFGEAGLKDEEVVRIAGRFTDAFTKKFGSLLCRDLRPGGFNKSDPPHLCEGLSLEAVRFSHDFIAAVATRRGLL